MMTSHSTFKLPFIKNQKEDYELIIIFFYFSLTIQNGCKKETFDFLINRKNSYDIYVKAMKALVWITI